MGRTNTSIPCSARLEHWTLLESARPGQQSRRDSPSECLCTVPDKGGGCHCSQRTVSSRSSSSRHSGTGQSAVGLRFPRWRFQSSWVLAHSAWWDCRLEGSRSTQWWSCRLEDRGRSCRSTDENCQCWGEGHYYHYMQRWQRRQLKIPQRIPGIGERERERLRNRIPTVIGGITVVAVVHF